MRTCLNVATAGVALRSSGHARETLEGEKKKGRREREQVKKGEKGGEKERTIGSWVAGPRP